MGASGSSSDAQIFNCSKLKRRIENGTLGLPPPEPLGPELHYFLLGDDALALMPWLMKPYSRQLTREERIANYKEQRPKLVRDIVLTCMVLHNMVKSHQGGAGRPPTSADDILAPQADQGEHGHHENFRNSSREAKHQ